MSLPRADKDQCINDNLDGLIRWSLQDSVAGAEPSPQVWERIQQHIAEERDQVAVHSRIQRAIRPCRSWFAWLVGTGTALPVQADPRVTWQRRVNAYDVRLAECSMPVLRLVT